MPPPGPRPIATNRNARRNFDILETLEVGVMLVGSEVKSLREAKVQVTDAFGVFHGGELWLQGVHISPYSHSASHTGHDPDRRRKLLAHKGELERLRSRVEQEHLALPLLALYFKDGRAKAEIALARGRSKGDKRQAIAKADADREARAAMARRNKYGG